MADGKTVSGKAWFECCVSLHFSLKGRMSVAIHDRRTPARYTWSVRYAPPPRRPRLRDAVLRLSPGASLLRRPVRGTPHGAEAPQGDHRPLTRLWDAAVQYGVECFSRRAVRVYGTPPRFPLFARTSGGPAWIPMKNAISLKRATNPPSMRRGNSSSPTSPSGRRTSRRTSCAVGN